MPQPPFRGTAYISPHIIGPTDPTSLRSITYTGVDDHFGTFLFNVQIGEFEIEFQVNSEFESQETARREVDTYAAHFGRMPAFLLSELRVVEIEKSSIGDVPALAGNQTVYIFTDHDAGDFAEEIMIHELGHVSLDEAHVLKDGWRNAQLSDPNVISLYARRYSDREDIAESIVAWFAARIRPDRLPAEDLEKILTAIPNRLSYFDQQGFDVTPYTVE